MNLAGELVAIDPAVASSEYTAYMVMLYDEEIKLALECDQAWYQNSQDQEDAGE